LRIIKICRLGPRAYHLCYLRNSSTALVDHCVRYTTSLFLSDMYYVSDAHLHVTNILHNSQHGFCKSRSTTTLLECLSDWTLTILSSEQYVVACIDFSKAFDVVSHPKLFARLYSYDIRGTVLL